MTAGIARLITCRLLSKRRKGTINRRSSGYLIASGELPSNVPVSCMGGDALSEGSDTFKSHYIFKISFRQVPHERSSQLYLDIKQRKHLRYNFRDVQTMFISDGCLRVLYIMVVL